MRSTRNVFYRLAPGVDVVRLSGGRILLASDTFTVRLEGESATFFADEVLPALTGHRSLSDIGAHVAVDEEKLRSYLDDLVERRVLICSEHGGDTGGMDSPLGPFLAMLQELGVEPDVATERLRQASVGIVGLEAHGAQLASMLADCHVGNLILADPYPCEPGNLVLMPGMGTGAVGSPRQDVVKAALDARSPVRTTVCGDKSLTRESVDVVARESQVLVACFDKAFSSANIWVNSVSLEHGIPAVYAQLRGHMAQVGPLVLPGQTACYLCWRMRTIACQDNFEEAMAYEEFLDRRRRALAHSRAILPFLSSYAASILALEIVKLLLTVASPSLAGKVHEFNGLTLQSGGHTVLQKPDCPACKKKAHRKHPLLGDMGRAPEADAGMVALTSSIVSPTCGVVRDVRPVAKDPSEPALPHVLQATISNHRFLTDVQSDLMASGKGFTREAAEASCLGESVERYSAACWSAEEVQAGRRSEMGEGAIDPRDLPLYAPEQYPSLPFVPYSDDAVLGWVQMRSLTTAAMVSAPALAVLMGYELRRPEEFLFAPTSNGLACAARLADAILAAALEVIERDAFVIAWVNRLACPRVDPLTHPDPAVVDLCLAYARRGLGVELYRLPTDFPCSVFLAMGIQYGERDGPAAVVGLGADLKPETAARKAVLEVAQVRPALRIRLRQAKARARLEELVANPALVSELEDHDLLYASRQWLPAFDFLRGGPLLDASWDDPGVNGRTHAGALEHLAEHCRRAGRHLLYSNLTPPDMETLGLFTVRVLIPGLQPIDFGANRIRLGGRRLFDLPVELGLRASPATWAELNPLPHPLA